MFVTFLKNNKTPLITLFLLAAFLWLAGLMQGCSLDRMIKVDVPKEVQGATGSDPVVTLREARFVFKDWKNEYIRGTERFAQNIEHAEEVEGFIRSFANTALAEAEPAIGSLPGGALIGMGLSFLTGLFLKRPGDAEALRKEKEESFNEGGERAVSLLRDASTQ